MADGNGAVAFRNVTKRFGALTVVDDVSFAIPAGSLMTLLGPSGCGKSTTLRLIAGLEMPDAGRIMIDGEDVTLLPVARRDIAMVFQSYALFPHLNVLDNVAFGLLNIGRSRADAAAAAREALDIVGLGGLERRHTGQLSGGQQQRVAVARAIVLRPKVLLLDEPLSNLDAKLRRQVRDDIRALQQRLKLTVVYVTHDQQEALAVSDRVVVMSAGRIAQVGTPEELYNAPTTRFVADFIGDANIVAATIEASDEPFAAVRVGRALLRLPARSQPLGRVEVALRPSSLAIEPPGHEAAFADGTVLRSAYLGECREYVVATDLGEIFVLDYQRRQHWGTGSAVALRVAGDGVTVLAG
jgi:iron(III) transport system ATP-binding protein